MLSNVSMFTFMDLFILGLVGILMLAMYLLYEKLRPDGMESIYLLRVF
jgi:hypothetical protein